MAHALRERLAWYANRLKAMSVPEVAWRVQQKALQKSEKFRFGKRVNVADVLLYPDLNDSKFAKAVLKGEICFDANAVIPEENITYMCQDKSAATATDTSDASTPDIPHSLWPDEWAYSLRYKQRDDIGDARLAWEGHRHFEWPRLALATASDYNCLQKLQLKFDAYASRNPMLFGIGWVSVMEVAIRATQWIYTAAILNHTGKSAGKETDASIRQRLQTGLLTGAANMISYVVRHRSRYSSANNHLLVELSAIALAGVAFSHEPWIKLAIAELERELPRQFSGDGVNLESSLHYHAFASEAYMHTALLLERAKRNIPESIYKAIEPMARFVQASMASGNLALEFGDADCGKLIDLTGIGFNYYKYILQLASVICGEQRFTDLDDTEPTVRFLTTGEKRRKASMAGLKEIPSCLTFNASPRKDDNPESGYTFLRSNDRKILIGIDHAPFGFGSIAAHAHADMLSFQLFENGRPVLTDGGTYLYHCNLTDRNLRRSEIMHNTVTLYGHPQGYMRGAFLWGKRGHSAMLHGSTQENGIINLQLKADMADGTPLYRDMTFNTADCKLSITDTLFSSDDITTFLVAPGLDVKICGNNAYFGNWHLESDKGKMHTETITVGTEYGKLATATAIRITGRTKQCKTTLAHKETDKHE